MGHITFIRSLSHGTTDRCEVVFDYKKEVEKIIRKMIDSFEIKGSCNIQAIVSKGGRVIPFEINGRISGTNSIRGQFGFEDVRYTLQEYLFNEDPEKPVIKKGAAVRVLMDVIYPNTRLDDVRNSSVKNYIF